MNSEKEPLFWQDRHPCGPGSRMHIGQPLDCNSDHNDSNTGGRRTCKHRSPAVQITPECPDKYGKRRLGLCMGYAVAGYAGNHDIRDIAMGKRATGLMERHQRTSGDGCNDEQVCVM